VTGANPVLHMGPVRSTRPWVRTFRGTLASVPEARRYVGELLAGCPARETLMMCVTELCANAVEHSDSGRGGSYTVEVSCPRDGLARVAVTDEGGACVPAPRTADPLADGGRGLAIVAACTSRWGVADAYPGRTVWAEATWPVAVPSCSPSSSPPAPSLGTPRLPRKVRPARRRQRHWTPPGWPGGPVA
jgi:serine/threonine-protein kinase RsbW